MKKNSFQGPLDIRRGEQKEAYSTCFDTSIIPSIHAHNSKLESCLLTSIHKVMEKMATPLPQLYTVYSTIFSFIKNLEAIFKPVYYKVKINNAVCEWLIQALNVVYKYGCLFTTLLIPI